MTARPLCDPLLGARNVALRVGDRTLLRDLSLDIRGGELWCLLGPNGCGKTTLLHALAGLRAPDAGEVRLAGRELDAWHAVEAARLRGFLPQAVHDAFSATVLEAVTIGRHPHLARWRWESDDDHVIARAALAAVGMADFAARDVLSLSGGERQRVAIAAVLAQDPPLMLLDEPVAHLDLRHQADVMRHLVHLAQAQGRAIAVSLHDVNLAARFATHALVFLPDGQAVQGESHEVLSEPILSEAYGLRIRRAAVDGRTVFIPE